MGKIFKHFYTRYRKNAVIAQMVFLAFQLFVTIGYATRNKLSDVAFELVMYLVVLPVILYIIDYFGGNLCSNVTEEVKK